jgi:membrane fusion protein (multidrug efflux system)
MNQATLNPERSGTVSFAAEAIAPRICVAQESEIRDVTVIQGTGEEPSFRQANEPPIGRTEKNTKRYLITGAIALVAGVAITAYYVKRIAPFETTDDAFIESHVTPIAPQVAGRVEKVLVNDNQFVNAGDALVQLDARDYEARLDQERANLASAQSRREQAAAQLSLDRAKVEQEKANVAAAEAEAKRAKADSARYQAVGVEGVSQSQLDLAATQARSADANAVAERHKELAAETQVTLDQAAILTAEAEIRKSGAAVRQAELNLSYAQVKAHEPGYVTHRTVEADSYAQPGQALLAIVPKAVWVVANFKETQLRHMRPGQPVTVRVDAYPQIAFTGHVDSIQAGTGSRFSLLPPENASGNYVKVVQRVPVKIVLDDTGHDGYALGAGMSAVPEVRVK